MSTQTIKKNIIVGTDSQIESRAASDPVGTIYLSTSEPDYPVDDVQTSTDGTNYSSVVVNDVAKIDLSPYLTQHQTMLYRPINVNGSEILSNTSGNVLNLAAGSNVTLTNNAGTVTIDAAGTTPSAATSSTAGVIKLGSDTVQTEAAQAVSSTQDRTYAVQVNGSGQAVVNVPWTSGSSSSDVTDVRTSTDGSTYTSVVTNHVADIDLSPYLTQHQPMLYRPIKVDGTQVLANNENTALDLVAGTNVTLTESNGAVTISAAGGSSGGVTDVTWDGTSIVNSGVAGIEGGAIWKIPDNQSIYANGNGNFSVSVSSTTGVSRPVRVGDIVAKTDISYVPAIGIVRSVDNYVRAKWVQPWTMGENGLTFRTDTSDDFCMKVGLKLVSNTTQSEAAQPVSATANRTYAIQVDSGGHPVVNVPWTGGSSALYHHTVFFNLDREYCIEFTNSSSTAMDATALDTWFSTHAYGTTSSGNLGSDIKPRLVQSRTSSSAMNPVVMWKAADNSTYYFGYLTNSMSTIAGTSSGYQAPTAVYDCVTEE